MTRPTTPAMAKLLAFALLPMLTFAGHWEPRIDIPFTNYYWGLPAQHNHAQTATHEHNHEGHCHGDSASCASKPVTSGVGFALLREALLLLGATTIAVGIPGRWWRPRRPASIRPELQPPQRAVA
jgi:hypothetical protein